MSAAERELYRSANGDVWLLVKDPGSGRPAVKHVPNAPSGGQSSEMEIGAFLAAGGHGPEHQELLRLIGTLVGERPAHLERSSVAGGPERKERGETGSYDVGDLAAKHGISNDQASRLIRQIGADRDKLDAEAARLKDRAGRASDRAGEEANPEQD